MSLNKYSYRIRMSSTLQNFFYSEYIDTKNHMKRWCIKMKKPTVIVLAAIALIILTVFIAMVYQLQWEENQKKELISYVDEAVELIEEKGQASFSEFRSPEWYKGDRYIFVWQLDGIRVVYPPDPKGEGKNMTDLKDYNGKPIGKLFIETAKKGEGWVEYIWPKPGEKAPSKKITYIKRAEYKNTTYLVGSGFYV